MQVSQEKCFLFNLDENGTLIIKSSNYQRDSGAYKCQAKNVAGNSEDIAMVYIQKPNRTENHCKTKTFPKIHYEINLELPV